MIFSLIKSCWEEQTRRIGGSGRVYYGNLVFAVVGLYGEIVGSFVGVVIEESLADKEVLKRLRVTKTVVEPVDADHRTPWLKQWTLHTIEIPEKDADSVARTLRNSLETEHNWYADFKNEKYAYIIFRDIVYKVDLLSDKRREQYAEAKRHGIFLGIPEYQVDFQ